MILAAAGVTNGRDACLLVGCEYQPWVGLPDWLNPDRSCCWADEDLAGSSQGNEAASRPAARYGRLIRPVARTTLGPSWKLSTASPQCRPTDSSPQGKTETPAAPKEPALQARIVAACGSALAARAWAHFQLRPKGSIAGALATASSRRGWQACTRTRSERASSGP